MGTGTPKIHISWPAGQHYLFNCCSVKQQLIEDPTTGQLFHGQFYFTVVSKEKFYVLKVFPY